MVYFSDNITTIEFTDAVTEFRAAENPPGCRLVGRDVEDPERFGVAVFDDNGELADIVEETKGPAIFLCHWRNLSVRRDILGSTGCCG